MMMTERGVASPAVGGSVLADADAEARIGGDAYAIQDVPFGIRILISDIRGQGVGAVSITTTLIGAFREAPHHTSSLEELAERLEISLERDQAQHSHPSHDEEFTTALIAEVDHAGRTLRLLDRGHPAPYLIRSGRVIELLPADPGLPLGITDGVTERLRRGPQHRRAHRPGRNVDHAGQLNGAGHPIVQADQHVQRDGIDLHHFTRRERGQRTERRGRPMRP
ncbi:PP2C family protein-serine/threonine phosphatase [Streptomyces cyaneofuscatus]|uniref:PP2C family protein-serine/threonine phosphatase n=2 Tax=Streptomyces TaxID=1883 RepID=UPI0038073B11